MEFVVPSKKEGFAAVSLLLDQIKSSIPNYNGTEEFSRRVLTIAERYPDKSVSSSIV